MRSTEERKTYRLRSPDRLIPRNLLNGALDLDQIHGLRAQVDGRLGQDGLHFGELVLVARDEVEFLGRRHCCCSTEMCGPREKCVVVLLFPSVECWFAM
jgi:hypothetical protein